MDCGHVNTKRAELRDQACRLVDEGTTRKEAARILGLPNTTVYRWTDPDFHARDLARARAYKERCRGTCRICGAATNGSDGPGSASDYCWHCAPAVYHKIWTREAVIDAIQRYARLNGRPPTAPEWRTADPDNGYPCAGSVYGHEGYKPFTYWADAIAAAGFPRPNKGYYRRERAVGLQQPAWDALRFINDHDNCRPHDHHPKAWAAFDTLRKRGLIEKTGRGRYSITDDGRWALSNR